MGLLDPGKICIFTKIIGKKCRELRFSSRKLGLIEKETHLTITVGFHVSFDISCIAIFKFRRTEIVLGAVGPQIQTVEEKTARVNETRVNMQRENSCSV